MDLIVRAANGAEIVGTTGADAPNLELAIKDAVVRLWQTPPLAPKPIDADIAQWTGYPDVEAGLLQLDSTQVIVPGDSACASVVGRASELKDAYLLRSLCADSTLGSDAGLPPLDESSPAALVKSLNTILVIAPSNPFSDAEARRLIGELESMRARETSPVGRGALSRIAGILAMLLNDSERAHSLMLLAVSDDPLALNNWYQLSYAARRTGSASTAASLASVWFPQDPEFREYANSFRSDDLDARLRDGQLAYILEPTVDRTRFLGQTLAEAGRSEEVRALAATTPFDASSRPHPNMTTFLLGCIDLHDAMFVRALGRFEAPETGEWGLGRLPTLVEGLGRTEPTAARWTESFLAADDATLAPIAQSIPAAIAMCMQAGKPRSTRCLSRIERLTRGELTTWGAGGEAFFHGAERFAAGDVRAAVETWRALVAGSNETLGLLLPTSAFERAGEPDLAARLDARKMQYRDMAGVSEATPREAHRAFDHGDRARAKELAQSVVHAWEVADVDVPAVAEMRALLAKIGD